ncbi:unnamed protein product, partial [Phaeothamnion confervicola]
MGTAVGSLTLDQVRRYLEISGADAEAGKLLKATSQPLDGPGAKPQGRRDNDRANQIASLRAKQHQVMSDKGRRDAELAALVQAEEQHREAMLRDKEERTAVARQLFSLQRTQLDERRAGAETELLALQTQREQLAAREKEMVAQIAAVREQMIARDKEYHDGLEQRRLV